VTGRLLITGAPGFLGQAVVAAALEAGRPVRALGRDRTALDAAPWAARDGVETVAVDLAAADARAALAGALEGVDAVVHAAAALAGDDVAQRRDTVAPTETLIAAMTARPSPPRLVLISSIAVYNYASVPAWSQIDETTPLEPEPMLRDAYCRAKLAQETAARRAAQTQGLAVRALRPGAIVGPGRLRTARLGWALGPLLVMPGGRAPIPVIAVRDCARLILSAADAPPVRSDFPVLAGEGWFEAINLVGAEQPAQADYATTIRKAGWPKATARLPLGLARAPARASALGGLVLPGLVRRLPGALRIEAFDARFKPLRFAPSPI
jgi:nucleoside-diphosphate-sugar epimerase